MSVLRVNQQAMATNPVTEPSDNTELPSTNQRKPFWTEDLLAILIGWAILVTSLACVQFITQSSSEVESTVPETTTTEVTHLLSGWVAKPGSWEDNPLKALGGLDAGLPKLKGVLGAGAILGLLFGLAIFLATDPTSSPGKSVSASARCTSFLRGYVVAFLLATLAYLMAGQAMVKAFNLEYALWALAIGLAISNTIGVPDWLRAGARTEFYIKTGLVLLGSEILMSRLLALGLPGVFVAWVVTPIVLITTFWFGQKILRISSPTLNMVISADMSVCGVSAAIASAAACRAKKEELSFAIGLSLSFTVLMMVLMPAVIRGTGMDVILGGAWMGGTIDATGAVAAAGEMLGGDDETSKRALEVAVTIKMIQNILIGVVAFGIAVFWTKYMDRDENSPPNVGWSEVWIRFPKFILGFIAASILFSVIHAFIFDGNRWTEVSIGVTKSLRGWLFCLAFVSIGLETNFAELKKYLHGGKPLILYVCGQTLNLTLTLAMAYLMFKVVFPDAVAITP